MSATHDCARSLRESILDGRLPAGLRLPTERELAARFGVNRSTVRGALAQLEAEHLVSPRQGSGYTVHDFRREAGPDLIASLAAVAQSAEQVAIVRDLLLVRRHLARAMLERLAEVADERALATVDDAIDAFERLAATRPPTSELARADADCTAALVAATGSTVLQLCVNPVTSLVARLPRLQEAMYRDPASNVLAYRAVVAWARSKRHRGIDAILEALAARDEATVAALAKTKKRPR